MSRHAPQTADKAPEALSDYCLKAPGYLVRAANSAPLGEALSSNSRCVAICTKVRTASRTGGATG